MPDCLHTINYTIGQMTHLELQCSEITLLGIVKHLLRSEMHKRHINFAIEITEEQLQFMYHIEIISLLAKSHCIHVNLQLQQTFLRRIMRVITTIKLLLYSTYHNKIAEKMTREFNKYFLLAHVINLHGVFLCLIL